MGIVAAFDKMLFSNPASKYCVMRVKTADMMIPQEARSQYRFRDNLIRFVAVGYDLPQTDSIQIDLDGKWVNGKYGVQLQVEHWREVIPPTIEGIKGYLSSGLLKGIGPKTAAVMKKDTTGAYNENAVRAGLSYGLFSSSGYGYSRFIIPGEDLGQARGS